jgi:hypothetical protein
MLICQSHSLLLLSRQPTRSSPSSPRRSSRPFPLDQSRLPALRCVSLPPAVTTYELAVRVSARHAAIRRRRKRTTFAIASVAVANEPNVLPSSAPRSTSARYHGHARSARLPNLLFATITESAFSPAVPAAATSTVLSAPTIVRPTVLPTPPTAAAPPAQCERLPHFVFVAARRRQRGALPGLERLRRPSGMGGGVGVGVPLEATRTDSRRGSGGCSLSDEVGVSAFLSWTTRNDGRCMDFSTSSHSLSLRVYSPHSSFSPAFPLSLFHFCPDVLLKGL